MNLSQSNSKQLVLSLFTGVGLLDKAFKEKGFIVVSAGDIIYGQDIREFKGIVGRFDGIIGGSPCQDFSYLKRNRGRNKRMHLLYHRTLSTFENPYFQSSHLLVFFPIL